MVKKARVAPSDTERFADFEILPINYLCFLASLFSCYPTIFGFLFLLFFVPARYISTLLSIPAHAYDVAW